MNIGIVVIDSVTLDQHTRFQIFLMHHHTTDMFVSDSGSWAAPFARSLGLSGTMGRLGLQSLRNQSKTVLVSNICPFYLSRGHNPGYIFRSILYLSSCLKP